MRERKEGERDPVSVSVPKKGEKQQEGRTLVMWECPHRHCGLLIQVGPLEIDPNLHIFDGHGPEVEFLT